MKRFSVIVGYAANSVDTASSPKYTSSGVRLVEGLLRAHRVVELKMPRQRVARLDAVDVGMQVNLLALDGSPRPLNEYAIDPANPASHADGDTGTLDMLGPLLAPELRALVGVEISGTPRDSGVADLS